MTFICNQQLQWSCLKEVGYIQTVSANQDKKKLCYRESTARPVYLIGVLNDTFERESVDGYLLGQKATEFGEIKQNNGHYAV